MEERKWCVYCHTSPSNKKYIGMTKHSKNPNRRWCNGRGYINNEYFYRAILKYGWNNFKHEILESKLYYEECGEREKYYISIFKSNQNSYGYNIESGGNACKELSNATKEKIRNKNIGKTRTNSFKENRRTYMLNPNNNPRYGISVNFQNGLKRTTESRNRMSESAKKRFINKKNHPMYGKHHTTETKEKLMRSSSKHVYFKHSINGEIIKKYNSKFEIEREGYNYSAVFNSARGHSKTAYGYYWTFDGMLEYKILEDKKIIKIILDNLIFIKYKDISSFYQEPLNCHIGEYLKGTKPMPQKWLDRGLRYYNPETDKDLPIYQNTIDTKDEV